jgi:hypothetical protein
MNKEFIPYTEALALEKLGFSEPCFGWYGPTGILNDWDKTDTIAPLYQQVFRWFREKFRLDAKPEYFLNDWYCFIINDMKGKDNSRRLFTEFPSYEEAELECLKKLIKICNELK